MFDQLTCEKGLTSCSSCDLLPIMTHVLARLHAYTVRCVCLVGDACDWPCISHQCSPATWRSESCFSEVCKSVSRHQFRWRRHLWNFLTKVTEQSLESLYSYTTFILPRLNVWNTCTHPHTLIDPLSIKPIKTPWEDPEHQCEGCCHSDSGLSIQRLSACLRNQ